MSGLSKKYTWPSNFPPGVPPEEAMPTEGKMFRLVNSFPTTKNDFLPSREENKHRSFHENLEVYSYGMSFFESLREIQRTRERFPNTLGHRQIATGILISDLGVMLKTFSKDHWTVWIQEGAEPWIHINTKVDK